MTVEEANLRQVIRENALLAEKVRSLEASLGSDRQLLLDRATEALDEVMCHAIDTQGFAQDTFNAYSDLRSRQWKRERDG